MLCLGSGLSPSLGSLSLREQPLRPHIRVHPARAEQEWMVRGGQGEMQQSEENKPKTSFLLGAVRKTPGGELIAAVIWHQVILWCCLGWSLQRTTLIQKH